MQDVDFSRTIASFFGLREELCGNPAEEKPMTERVTRSGLQVAIVLKDLLENDIAPGTGIAPAHFWAELAEIVKDFLPRNRELLAKRDALQEQLDTWYQELSLIHI